MISEPELTGGLDAPPADATPRVPAQGGPPPGDVVADTGPGPAARLRARLPRHWLWALCGAATASAVWAAGILVWNPTHTAPPDLHGYRLMEDPCTAGVLRPLFDAVHSPHFTSGVVNVVRGPALDAQTCTANSSDPGDLAPTAAYTASVTVELHRTTDPRPEFEAEHTLPHDALTAARSAEPVAGLGDEAYLLHQDATLMGLEVLHGGAVVRIELTAVPILAGSPTHPDGSPRPAMPRIDSYRPALIAAMRNLTAGLQQAPAGSPLAR